MKGQFTVLYLSSNTIYFYTGSKGTVRDIGTVKVFDSYEEAEAVAKEMAVNTAISAAWVARLECKATRSTPPVVVTTL